MFLLLFYGVPVAFLLVGMRCPCVVALCICVSIVFVDCDSIVVHVIYMLCLIVSVCFECCSIVCMLLVCWLSCVFYCYVKLFLCVSIVVLFVSVAFFNWLTCVVSKAC